MDPFLLVVDRDQNADFMRVQFCFQWANLFPKVLWLVSVLIISFFLIVKLKGFSGKGASLNLPKGQHPQGLRYQRLDGVDKTHKRSGKESIEAGGQDIGAAVLGHLQSKCSELLVKDRWTFEVGPMSRISKRLQ